MSPFNRKTELTAKVQQAWQAIANPQLRHMEYDSSSRADAWNTKSRHIHTSWTNTKSGSQVGYSNHTKFTGKSMTQGCTADIVIEERAQ